MVPKVFCPKVCGRESDERDDADVKLNVAMGIGSISAASDERRGGSWLVGRVIGNKSDSACAAEVLVLAIAEAAEAGGISPSTAAVEDFTLERTNGVCRWMDATTDLHVVFAPDPDALVSPVCPFVCPLEWPFAYPLELALPFLTRSKYSWIAFARPAAVLYLLSDSCVQLVSARMGPT
jgi:hypothetical protein